MKSSNVSVTKPVYVWAIPKNPDYDDMEGDLFKYEFGNSGSYHWHNAAVCVYEQDVTIEVPAGIDMLGKAVETIDAKIVQAEVEFNNRVSELNKQKQQLLFLTHQPENNDHDLVGEFIAEVDDYRGADHE